MVRQEYFNEIEKRLSWLRSRVELRGSLNIYDQNIHCEYFYMHLLNMLYNWNLVNANTTDRNQPAFDLIFESQHIIVQVSSTNKKSKVQSSLDKLDTKYKGYNFKFVSISKSSSHLRKYTYNTPVEVSFDPKKDIYDIEKILSTISALTTEACKKVYDFITTELAYETSQIKIETGIATVINLLSEVDLQNCDISFNAHTFELDDKVKINNINIFRAIIEQYKSYYPIVDNIYNEYDAQGKNKSFAVLQLINREYLKLKDNHTGDSIYYALSNRLKEQLNNSANLNNFSIEDIELYIDIVLVDAFIRCKIFERP